MHCDAISSYHSPVTSLLITHHLPVVAIINNDDAGYSHAQAVDHMFMYWQVCAEATSAEIWGNLSA